MENSTDSRNIKTIRALVVNIVLAVVAVLFIVWVKVCSINAQDVLYK